MLFRKILRHKTSLAKVRKSRCILWSFCFCCWYEFFLSFFSSLFFIIFVSFECIPFVCHPLRRSTAVSSVCFYFQYNNIISIFSVCSVFCFITLRYFVFTLFNIVCFFSSLYAASATTSELNVESEQYGLRFPFSKWIVCYR